MNIIRYFSVLPFFMMSFLCNTYEEKPIVVVIPSYNNQEWYKKNIQSIAMQNYSNYRVIYINDCSTDGTGDLVRAYVEELGVVDRFTIIDNDMRCGALANIYRAVHTCEDNDIIAIVDGDDWIAHNKVLARINRAYSDGTTWMTYGQFKTHPYNTKGFCAKLPNGVKNYRSFRNYRWATSHLRTYYAGLFKQIHLKDLLYKGEFFDVSGDMAVMYLQLEMATNHFTFIPDILYVYNMTNSISDFRQKRSELTVTEQYIRGRQKSPSVDSIETSQDISVDVVVFSDGNSDTLSCFLACVKTNLHNIHKITVMCPAEKISSIKRLHHHVVPYGSSNIKTVLLHELNTSDSAYVLFANDQCQLDSCNIIDCAYALKATYAHAFYLGRGRENQQELSPMVSIYADNTIYAWQYTYANFAFKRPYDIDMTLYKKDTIRLALSQVTFDNPERMVTELNGLNFDYEQVGLCFESACTKKE